MGVYVKGMKMPKSCPCKLVGVGYDMHCAFVSGVPSRVREYYECCEKETRPDWCPLVEAPDDGVVVSKDEFQYYSRAMLAALTLHDLLVAINSFAEVPKSIEPVANAPAGNEAEE